MSKSNRTETNKSNKLRSYFLELANKEVSEYLKSNILINSMPIQKYVDQFTYQIVEIKNQSFCSINSASSTPMHSTNNFLNFTYPYLKQNSITKSPKSPKKKKIGKEKLSRFKNQINNENNKSPKLSIDSFKSANTSSPLNKSFESVISIHNNHNEKKTKKKEGRTYLMNLSSSFKFKKTQLSERGNGIRTKLNKGCNKTYNPLYKSMNSLDNGNMNLLPAQILNEGNAMFTITINSSLD